MVRQMPGVQSHFVYLAFRQTTKMTKGWELGEKSLSVKVYLIMFLSGWLSGKMMERPVACTINVCNHNLRL
jgi:hypothetical protein